MSRRLRPPAGTATLEGFDPPVEAPAASRSAAPADRLSVGLDVLLADAPADWSDVLQAWRAGPAGRAVAEALGRRLDAGAVIHPASPLRALALTPRARVRIVILGQDPYHGPGQAEGLAFSVPHGVPRPPSLRNIDVELARDLGVPVPSHGHLGDWARRGVLLLNTALTVEAGQAGSHARIGWAPLTDALITATAADPGVRAYLLWGAHAQSKAALIEAAGGGRHLVLMANHPSPLSARRPPQPFIGCGHFSRLAAWCAAQGLPEPDWRR